MPRKPYLFDMYVNVIIPFCESAQKILRFAHLVYRGADKSLARPRKKQARKHVRDARDCNYIETRAVIKFLFLQGKAPKQIHTILTETLARFLPGRAKDLSVPRVCVSCGSQNKHLLVLRCVRNIAKIEHRLRYVCPSISP